MYKQASYPKLPKHNYTTCGWTLVFERCRYIRQETRANPLVPRKVAVCQKPQRSPAPCSKPLKFMFMLRFKPGCYTTMALWFLASWDPSIKKSQRPTLLDGRCTSFLISCRVSAAVRVLRRSSRWEQHLAIVSHSKTKKGDMSPTPTRWTPNTIAGIQEQSTCRSICSDCAVTYNVHCLQYKINSIVLR